MVCYIQFVVASEHLLEALMAIIITLNRLGQEYSCVGGQLEILSGIIPTHQFILH